jgi:hypothetical protein
MGEIRSTYKVLIVNSEGKRPLGRSTYLCDVILKWILKK